MESQAKPIVAYDCVNGMTYIGKLETEGTHQESLRDWILMETIKYAGGNYNSNVFKDYSFMFKNRNRYIIQINPNAIVTRHTLIDGDHPFFIDEP